MPTRVIRDGFLDSELIAEAGDAAECLFVRLLLVADDYGRFDARAARVARACWPVAGPPIDEIQRRLAVLNGLELVLTYQVAGKPYLVIPRYRQRLRAMKSRFPDPPGDTAQRLAEIETGSAKKAPARRDPEPKPVKNQKPERKNAGRMPDNPPSNAGHMPGTCPLESETETETDKKQYAVVNRGPSTDISPNDGHLSDIRQSNPEPEPAADPETLAEPIPERAPEPQDQPDDSALDQQAQAFGMERLAFETDDDLRIRLQARKALG